MVRFHETAAWLLNSLGAALLVCSVVLSPQSGFGVSPLANKTVCPNSSGCNNGCITKACATLKCKGTGCTCTNTGYNSGCTVGNCSCQYFSGSCFCEGF